MTEQARDTEALIRDQIAKHPVLLYMKGTPQFPQCGFSARAVEALSQIGRPFAYVNILKTLIFVQHYQNCELAYFPATLGKWRTYWR